MLGWLVIVCDWWCRFFKSSPPIPALTNRTLRAQLQASRTMASVVADPSDIVVPQGPFGGPGGANAYYDGVGDVVQIAVTYSGQAVNSMQTVYQQAATKFTTGQHGTNGPRSFTIKLDFPTEYLVQVKGTSAPGPGVASDVVTSLTFVTNKTTYGPFGAVVGRQFQSSPQGKVVGFFGRSGDLLDSIGIFTQFSDPDDDVSAEGPWGGAGGGMFYDGRADGIVEIEVEHGEGIISLNVKYAQGKKGFLSTKHGGDGKFKGVVDKIVFKSDEYLAQVTGTHGVAHGLRVVTSLTFITNKRSYGPFGAVSGTSFETLPNSRVLGFYGRCGWMVDQLGAFVAQPPLPVLVSEPWGGLGGGPFYEGRGEISQITVVYTGQYISKLQVTYLQGGEPFAAPTHGTAQGQTAVIKLNPDEYVVQVLGTHGQGSNVAHLIRSLKFVTNKATYGPYGNTSGASFASPKEGRVVGFFGRSGDLLDQLGAIVAPSTYYKD